MSLDESPQVVSDLYDCLASWQTRWLGFSREWLRFCIRILKFCCEVRNISVFFTVVVATDPVFQFYHPLPKLRRSKAAIKALIKSFTFLFGGLEEARDSCDVVIQHLWKLIENSGWSHMLYQGAILTYPPLSDNKPEVFQASGTPPGKAFV